MLIDLWMCINMYDVMELFGSVLFTPQIFLLTYFITLIAVVPKFCVTVECGYAKKLL